MKSGIPLIIFAMYINNFGVLACNYFIILSAISRALIMLNALDKSDIEFSTQNKTDKGH
jgi:hypothetical protein